VLTGLELAWYLSLSKNTPLPLVGVILLYKVKDSGS
jgi:hypothetical protein